MTIPSALLFGSIATLCDIHYNKDGHDAPTLRASAARLIDEAKAQRVRLGFVSDLPAATVRRQLLSLEPELSVMDFSVITSRDSIYRPKPNPDAYMRAIRQLGVAADQCIAIEETHTAALSSLKAGIRTMVVPDPTSPPFRTRDFDDIVRSRLGPMLPVGRYPLPG